MEKEQHLPMYGIGPFYVIGIVLATIIGIVLSKYEIMGSGVITKLEIPFTIIGVLFIIYGICIWAASVFISKIDNNIKDNKLCTTGMYAYVRNPIYSGFMFACTGVLFFANNLWLLLLPFVYWLAMTILLKNTEEKWLQNLYGLEYIDYCKRVNRCIPWCRKKKLKTHNLNKVKQSAS